MRLRVRLRLGAWLVLLTAFAALPLIAFSGYAVYQLGLSQSKATAILLTQRTEATANAVAERLSAALGGLHALAQSDTARKGDVAALAEFARRVRPLYPEVLAINMVRSDGEMIFHTSRPFGEALPPTADIDSAGRAIATGRPVISGPFMGAVSKVWAVSLGLPVSLGDKGVLCLRMNMSASSFNDVLGEQRLPEHWTGVLLAADGTTVARTRSPESAIGTKAPPSLVKAQAEQRTGLFPTLTREGVPSSTALSKVPGWDLWVAIAVPEASIDAEADRFLIEVAVAGCAVLAASIVVALWLARHLAGQITRASAASAALADGHADSVPDSDIVELGAMGAALGTVKAREIETQAALLEAVSVNEQTAAALSQAQCDQLTGLAGRGLFLDQAQALKDNCPDGSGLAILFIDLDGFKAVNDTLGHEAGDRVLVRAADILRAAIGAGDVVGRLGGDEFVIGVAGPIDAIGELAADIAGRLVASIATIGDGIGCSIGVATPYPAPERLGDIMKRADQAMYAAKRHGKNCYVVAQR